MLRNALTPLSFQLASAAFILGDVFLKSQLVVFDAGKKPVWIRC